MFSENEKKIIIGLLVSFLLCAVFCQLASPQSYMVTESQLQILETEFTNLKNENSQNLKSAETWKKVSEDRQQALKELDQYCSQLDSKLLEAEKIQVQTEREKNEALIKLEKVKREKLISIVINGVELLIIGILVYLLIRRRYKCLIN